MKKSPRRRPSLPVILGAGAVAGGALLAVGYVPARPGHVLIKEPCEDPPYCNEWEPTPTRVTSPAQCAALEAVILRRFRRAAQDGVPVSPNVNMTLDCRWKDRRLRTLTADEIERCEESALTSCGPTIPVDSVRLSPLRIVGVVEAGVQWAELAGQGEACLLVRTFTGWAILRCGTSWIS